VRIGVVTKWFNRGQPVVGRHTRSALDQLGHETFVLARPKKERGPMPGALARDGVWDQPGVTEASAYDIPLAEYVAWIEDNGIEAIFCDQNYQFDELAELRRRGVLVIGRFVWEHFTAEHTEGVRRAYDLVFSMTRAEQERYRGMGLETPYVPWGCHPELIAVAREVRREPRETVTFVFPGGFLGHRKPLEPVLEAWSRVRSPRARLVVKAQVERRLEAAERAAAADPRITLRIGDEPTPEHLRAVAACVDRAVQAAGLDHADIDVVLRTGGSSRIPAYVRMLAGKFGADKLQEMDTFTSVASGLAIAAARGLAAAA